MAGRDLELDQLIVGDGLPVDRGFVLEREGDGVADTIFIIVNDMERVDVEAVTETELTRVEEQARHVGHSVIQNQVSRREG